MPVDLVCVGEIVADLISPARDLANAGHFRRFLGGSAGNIASNFSALGGEAALVSAVGDDPFGEYCLDSLALKGVRLNGVRVQRGARTNIAFVTDASGGPTTSRARQRLLKIGETEGPRSSPAPGMLHLSAAASRPEAGTAVLRLLDGRSGDRRRASSASTSGYIRAFHSRDLTLQRLTVAARHRVQVVPARGDRPLRREPPETTLDRLCDLGFRRAVLTLGAEGHLALCDSAVAKRRNPARPAAASGTPRAPGTPSPRIFIGLLAGSPSPRPSRTPRNAPGSRRPLGTPAPSRPERKRDGEKFERH
jgi:sugar/nucleoside kinase (ribokinase family)